MDFWRIGKGIRNSSLPSKKNGMRAPAVLAARDIEKANEVNPNEGESVKF